MEPGFNSEWRLAVSGSGILLCKPHSAILSAAQFDARQAPGSQQGMTESAHGGAAGKRVGDCRGNVGGWLASDANDTPEGNETISTKYP
jgi:hypothetical protein